jgi:hypothetical protein
MSETKALIGQSGALELLKRYGKPATPKELHLFMQATYPEKYWMSEEMITMRLNKAAPWEECWHDAEGRWHIGPPIRKPLRW